jgi:hypothetical protein
VLWQTLRPLKHPPARFRTDVHLAEVPVVVLAHEALGSRPHRGDVEAGAREVVVVGPGRAAAAAASQLGPTARSGSMLRMRNAAKRH